MDISYIILLGCNMEIVEFQQNVLQIIIIIMVMLIPYDTDNSLSSQRHQAIIYNNADIVSSCIYQ